MGLTALTLPLGAVAALGTPALAKAPSPNPIVCSGFGATITFHTPYEFTKSLAGHSNVQGTATSSKLGGTTSVVGTAFNCGGGTGNGTFSNITITPGKNDKLAKTDSRYNKTTGVKYVEGDAAGFFTGGAKSLKKSLKSITFHINGHTTAFKQSGTPTLVTGNAPCPGEVGYVIHGKVSQGGLDYYYDKTAVLNVCLGTDSGTGTHANFLGDLLGMKNGTWPSSVTVTGAVIDPTNSNATL